MPRRGKRGTNVRLYFKNKEKSLAIWRCYREWSDYSFFPFFLSIMFLSLLIVPTAPLALFFLLCCVDPRRKKNIYVRQRGEKANPKEDDTERTPKARAKKVGDKRSANASPCVRQYLKKKYKETPPSKKGEKKRERHPRKKKTTRDNIVIYASRPLCGALGRQKNAIKGRTKWRNQKKDVF